MNQNQTSRYVVAFDTHDLSILIPTCLRSCPTKALPLPATSRAWGLRS